MTLKISDFCQKFDFWVFWEATGHSGILEISPAHPTFFLVIDFASRVPPRQPEAQFLIQNSIFDNFENFGFLSKIWFLSILGGHWTLGDSGNVNVFGF